MKRIGITFLFMWFSGCDCFIFGNGLSNPQLLKCLSSSSLTDLDCGLPANRICCRIIKRRRRTQYEAENFGSSRKFPHFPALDTSESSPRRPVTDVAGPNFEDVPIYEDIITQEGQSDRIKEESFEDESAEDYNEESDSRTIEDRLESSAPIVMGKRLEDNLVDIGNDERNKDDFVEKCSDSKMNCSIDPNDPCCGSSNGHTFRPTVTSSTAYFTLSSSTTSDTLDDEMIQKKFCQFVQTECSSTSKHPCCLNKLAQNQSEEKLHKNPDSSDYDEPKTEKVAPKEPENDLCKMLNVDCQKNKENSCCTKIVEEEESLENLDQFEDFSKNIYETTTKFPEKKSSNLVTKSREHLMSKGLCSSVISHCDQYPDHPCCVGEDNVDEIEFAGQFDPTRTGETPKPLLKSTIKTNTLPLLSTRKPIFLGGQRRAMKPDDQNSTGISEASDTLNSTDEVNTDLVNKGYDRGMCAILKVPCRFVNDHPCCDYEMPIDLVARARSMDGSADLRWRKLKDGTPQARSFDSLFQTPTLQPRSQFFNKNIEYNHATSKSSVSIPRYYYDGGPETTSTILGVCWRLLYLKCPPPPSPHDNHLQSQSLMPNKIHPCCQLSRKPSVDSTGNSRISKWLTALGSNTK